MVVTGTARMVAVKIFYQLGFDDPMLVTLLYLLGQSLALLVYFLQRESEGEGGDHNNKTPPKSDSNRMSKNQNGSSSKLHQRSLSPN
jgi:hypothetical protein